MIVMSLSKDHVFKKIIWIGQVRTLMYFLIIYIMVFYSCQC